LGSTVLHTKYHLGEGGENLLKLLSECGCIYFKSWDSTDTF